jgi:hypothetical protein
LLRVLLSCVKASPKEAAAFAVGGGSELVLLVAASGPRRGGSALLLCTTMPGLPECACVDARPYPGV